jgi:hypothetical protein
VSNRKEALFSEPNRKLSQNRSPKPRFRGSLKRNSSPNTKTP